MLDWTTNNTLQILSMARFLLRKGNPMPYVSNPTRPAALRPVGLITDRAKRYRANKAIEQTEKRCIYCGKTSRQNPLMVDHIDGNEDNGSPENLAYACRPCNTSKGIHYARNGYGRKTRQMNPRRKRSSTGKGITSLAQFIKAIQTVKGEGPQQMELFEANALLHETPPNERSRWAREANERRWGSVPF